MEFFANYQHDFNDKPRFITRYNPPPQVGHTVRLVDLDATCGWAYAKVTAVRQSERDESVYCCDCEIYMDTFTSWPQSFVRFTSNLPEVYVNAT